MRGRGSDGKILDYSRTMRDVTRILTAIDRGDKNASAELLPLVYRELRKLAAAEAMRRISVENARRAIKMCQVRIWIF